MFEKYVNELMRQACDGTKSTFFPDPRPASDPNTQLCDGIVVSGDSIVLMEYKSSMFRADSKYSGDYQALAGEIEKKFVHDKEADQRKGVWQLAEAVKRIFKDDARPQGVASSQNQICVPLYHYAGFDGRHDWDLSHFSILFWTSA